jgi:hypothetical protein
MNRCTSGRVSFSPDGHRLSVDPAWSDEVTIYDGHATAFAQSIRMTTASPT